ncbi:hypothetical protein K469DRAFT_36516 [Zopfia rhizophila CBS 207.26]|uniref:Uncharacterized protein n=1 Tax=Zopfia rhizophila CBS 207.26 TaxID=1314779 RepID=A0A6A6DDA8_9PEZI|nr:hypothetical protein K469DRAFT_36516 [Zopfia rhizophila CBS 207.26]
MSAGAPNYSSAFPSEWALTDEDDRITTRSRSQSPSSPDDTTPTPSFQSTFESVSNQASSSRYLDHFPDSWTLGDSESSPPTSPTPRDADTVRLENSIQSSPDIPQGKHGVAFSVRSLDNLQRRATMIGDLSSLIARQAQRQSSEGVDDLWRQTQSRDWLDNLKRAQTSNTQPSFKRQSFLEQKSSWLAGRDVEIKPQNLLWFERLRQINAAKRANSVEYDREGKGVGNRYQDESKSDLDIEEDDGHYTQNGDLSEIGYGDVPHQRPVMSDGYSTYTAPSVAQ